MQRFAYWLFPLIAVAVAIFIVVFMVQINSPAPETGGQSALESGNSAPETEENGGWLERFSFGGDKEYFYPVNELMLDLDTNDSFGRSK